MIEPYYPPNSPDYHLELDPFSTYNWKTVQSRDNWQESLRKAANAKSYAEWKSVSDSETDRKAAIIHVYDNTREEWMRRIGEEGLHFRPIRYVEPYNGFAHSHPSTTKSDPNRITYAAISENPDVADAMEEAELELTGAEKHEAVGELLGFPTCCTKHFNDIWLSEEIYDPMYEISCNSNEAEVVDGNEESVILPDVNPGANILWKYFGWSFITHIPCSWSCEESIDIARERYRIMTEGPYGDVADLLVKWLSEPAEWSGYHGIATVKNRHIIGVSGTSDYWSKKTVYWNEKPSSL